MMAIHLSSMFDDLVESLLNQQTQYEVWLADKNQKTLSVNRLRVA